MKKGVIVLVIIGILLIVTIGTVHAMSSHDSGRKSSSQDSDSSSSGGLDSSSDSSFSGSKKSDEKTGKEEVSQRKKTEEIQTSVDKDRDKIQIIPPTIEAETEEERKVKQKIKLRDIEAVSNSELEQEKDTEKIKAKLSNGIKTEVKIMPNTASRIALAELRSQNRTLELKEVGKDDNLDVAYISEAIKTARFLGLFRMKYKSKVEIDAQTGRIIKLHKPWWRFLAKDLEEPEIKKMALQLIKPIQDIIIIKNTEGILDLDEYFLNAESYSVSEIGNISSVLEGGILTLIPEVNYTGTTSATITAYKGNESLEALFNIIVTEENLSVQIMQYPAILGEKVRWKKTIKSKKQNVKINLPQQSENITLIKLDSDEEIIDKEEIIGELIEIKANENVDSYEIEYYTPEAYAVEKSFIRTRKTMTIVGPGDMHYADVLAFDYLPIEANTEAVKLYLITEEGREEVEINKYDLNKNGLVDYIEWVIPSLNNQTYEIIIEIAKAEHLDSNRNFISDIYKEVYKLDDIWSEVISSEEYVRVTFKTGLDNTRDIKLYPRVVTGNPKIEVYEIDDTEVIAEFTSIDSNTYNQVFLTDLQGTQDTFDLRIVDGSLEIDHIIDPAVTLVSPLDNTYSSNPIQIFNCSATDDIMLANITLYGNWSGGWHANETKDVTGLSDSTTFTKTLEDGSYIWNCLVYDNDTNLAWAISNYTLTIDAILPIVSIIYPQNINYNLDISELNYTYTETNPDKCWWSNNSGIWNSSPQTCGTNWTGLVSNEGNNTWIVYINDTTGNENSTSVTFFKDTIYPLIDYGAGTANDYANLSQSNIYIDVSVTETNEDTITFLLYNSTGQVNSTSYNNGTRTINWTGLIDGAYTYNVTVNDTLGNSNTTSTRTITLDTTNPIMSFSCTPTSVVLEETITCSCSGTDATSGVQTTSYTTNPSTLNTGAYSTSCTIIDYANNSASSSISYTVSGAGGYPDYKISSQDLSGGYTKIMQKNWKMNFKIEDKTHTLSIEDISKNSISITLSSDPQKAILNIGDEKKFELTDDNYYDLLIKLNSIENSLANLTIQSIHEEILEEITDTEKSIKEGIKEEKNLIWLWIIIIIIILVLIGKTYKFKKSSFKTTINHIHKFFK